MERSVEIFSAYGGWILYPCNSLNEAAEIGAHAALADETRIRVLTVGIHNQNTKEWTTLVGYTDSARIPPANISHRDGDCSVCVDYYLDINYCCAFGEEEEDEAPQVDTTTNQIWGMDEAVRSGIRADRMADEGLVEFRSWEDPEDPDEALRLLREAGISVTGYDSEGDTSGGKEWAFTYLIPSYDEEDLDALSEAVNKVLYSDR